MLVLAVIPGMVACERPDSVSPDTSFPDASVTTDVSGDLPQNCGSGEDCPDEQVCQAGRCVPFRCTPGVTECWMGLVATCNAEGTGLAYESCPPGQVCRGEGCTANRAKVYFVTGAPRSGPMIRPEAVFGGCDCTGGTVAPPCALGADLATRVPAELAVQPDAWDEHFYGDYILFQRFVIRRVLGALNDHFGLHFALLHKPSIPGMPRRLKYGGDFHRWISGYRIAPESNMPDEIDDQWRGQVPGFRDWYRPIQEIIYYSWEEPLGWIPCFDPYFDDAAWFDSRMVTAVPPWGSAQDVAPWVDERVETRDLGNACPDGDCTAGFCLEERCVELSNPEIPGRVLDRSGWQPGISDRNPMLLYAANVIRSQGRLQGAACTGDDDCADPDYRCVEGHCDDPARFCTRHQVVFFEERPCYPFMYMLGTQDGVRELHSNWIAIWLSQGMWMPCESDRDCPSGPWHCVAYRPYWGYDAHPETAPRTCVPDYVTTSGPVTGEEGPLFCAGSRPVRFTTPYLTDRQGDRIRATVHVVDLLNVHDGWLATFGSGEPAAMALSCESPDWEERLDAITAAILQDAEQSTCTPDDVPAKYLPGYHPRDHRRFDWSPPERATCTWPVNGSSVETSVSHGR